MDLSRFDNRPLCPRDFQFSLARILVAMTICAVLLSFKLPLLLGVIGWILLVAVVLSILFCDWSAWHVMSGNTALRFGNHPRAVLAYTRAIKANPQDPARYYCRAIAYSYSRHLDAAIEDFTKAIDLDRHYAPAWIGRADVKRQRGEYQAAIDDATIGLCVVPPDPKVWIARVSGFVVRGACYLALGRTEEGFEELDEAVRVAPDHAEPYSMRGYMLLWAKAYEQALSDFDEALTRGRREHATLVNRAFALFKLGRYEAAFRQISACRHEHPHAVDALRTHARFLATCPDDQFRDGRLALALATSARRLAGTDDWACEASLAAAHAELGQFDEAVEHADKAIELAPPLERDDLQEPLAAYKARRPYRDDGLDEPT